MLPFNRPRRPDRPDGLVSKVRGTALLMPEVLLRRLAMVAVDAGLIAASVVGAFALRLQDRELLISSLEGTSQLIPLALICGLPVLYFSGWYRGLTRYAGSHSMYGLLPRSALMVLTLLLVNTLAGAPTPPRSFWILYWILFTGTAIGARIVLRDLLLHQLGRNQVVIDGNRELRTVIYGAGSSGLNLLMALRNDPRFRVVAFLDDDSRLHGRTVQALPIHSPTSLPDLIRRQEVGQVLLALPSTPRQRKRLLVDQLSHSGLRVLSIPSLSQLASGTRTVSDLQPVAIEDLLGREPSSPDPALLAASVRDKAVMVTGAGGSIGSEICRQVVALGARTLVMHERSEFALYSIERELRDLNHAADRPVHLRAVLGDAADFSQLEALCQAHGIQTIFHAAAYKHVPIVEANLCAGVANNIHATRAVVQAACASGVERVTLISTDKAVRPTNVMGASKRICELLIQDAAEEVGPDGPVFSMVRFGNVLGSSGSVIPLFHQQIAAGGPVTVTHPAITRYFMTIPEAVALVLQATGMATGGDLFLLDMGEPVRIADLARQMIELSGLRVRDEANPHGDIAIHYTGLRPGEKLYEELLISSDAAPTAHPLILRASEPVHPPIRFRSLLAELDQALRLWDHEATSRLLRQLVPEYQPESTNHSPTPLPARGLQAP
ncbi:polysaccharide biosynthesis protein [Cyanobium sp. FGCU-6]|nr:polysaccharide biosynthesis protein [Cyanobium sp. FGCU6]